MISLPSRALQTLDLLILLWWDGLDISLMLGHVLLHLKVEVVHEGPVLLVDDIVGDH